jgi:HEAT repeat protein
VEAKAAVPALIDALKDDEADVRGLAADALGGIGAEAKAAVPALIEAFKDEADYYRSWRGYPHKVSAAATYALSKIDPEAARRAGVP